MDIKCPQCGHVYENMDQELEGTSVSCICGFKWTAEDEQKKMAAERERKLQEQLKAAEEKKRAEQEKYLQSIELAAKKYKEESDLLKGITPELKSRGKKNCIFCKEEINSNAERCPYCTSWLNEYKYYRIEVLLAVIAVVLIVFAVYYIYNSEVAKQAIIAGAKAFQSEINKIRY